MQGTSSILKNMRAISWRRLTRNIAIAGGIASFSQPSILWAQGRVDADGVPMAIGADLYGPNGAFPSTPTPVPTQQGPRFADVRFDTAITAPPANSNGPSSTNVLAEQIYASGRLLAMVGDEPILEGDVRPMVDPMLHKNGVPRNQWDSYRERLLRPALVEQITNKCLAQKFMKDMVGTKPPKEYAEAKKKIDPRISQSFYEKVIPKLMTDYNATTPIELDQKLRESGTSLTAQQLSFRDSILAQQAIEKAVPSPGGSRRGGNENRKKNVTLHELRDYYDAHLSEWNRPARARWRQISVRFKNHPSKQAAREKLSNLGNELVFGAAPFEAIAKKKSEGFTADEGGVHDWTTQGSLRSTQLDQNIFSLPLRRLSDIIEDEEGYHIIEILERENARTVPLEEVQEEIRDRIQSDSRSTAIKEYLQKVKGEAHVWTLWPEDVPGSHPLSELTP